MPGVRPEEAPSPQHVARVPPSRLLPYQGVHMHPPQPGCGGKAELPWKSPVKCKEQSKVQLLTGVYSNAPAVVALRRGFFIYFLPLMG